MRRNQGLDILRGIAILAVMGFHYKYVPIWSRMGWAGVDLFFVLSGFLISGLLFSEYKRDGSLNLLRFWIRRGFKIYPPFYAFMLFTALVCIVERKPMLRYVLIDALYLRSYFHGYWDHTWTLAVEEQFYILLPILLILLIRLRKNAADPFRPLLPIFWALCFGCLALRAFALERNVWVTWVTFRTHLRIDSLFCGVALSYCYHFRRNLFAQISRMPLTLIGAVLVLPAFILERHTICMCTTGLTMVFLGCGCFLVRAVQMKESSFVGWRALANLGRYSYSIYLWHRMLSVWVFQNISRTLPHFAVYFVASVMLGFVMAQLIEIPALALRERIVPRTQPVHEEVTA